MNRTHTAAHMEGQQLYTDLVKANERIRLVEISFDAELRHSELMRKRVRLLDKVYEAACETGLGSSEWANRLDIAIAAVEAQDD